MSVCANPECDKEVVQTSKYRVKKTCSNECRYAVSASTTKNSSGRWETKVCPCGVEFQSAITKPKTYHDWDCMMKHRVEDARLSRTCEAPDCTNEFTYFKRQDQRTCSPACRNKVTAAQREINYPKCRTCGVSTGSYNRIYCDEHRPERPGRKPGPRKTAICQNPNCNDGNPVEFSRPGTWPGSMMFCGLKCSNEQHSRKRARHYKYGEVNLNGSYELRFMACLARLIIDWAPWPSDQALEVGSHTYIPDFLVDGMAIEIKGGEAEDHPQRAMRAAWDRPEPLILVDREKLARLEKMFNRQEFLEALRAMETS